MKKHIVLSGIFTVFALLQLPFVQSSAQEANYDESKIPAYSLPDPLVSETGTPIRDSADWKNKRRPEVLELFRTHVYGHMPGNRTEMREISVETLFSDENALGGLATMKQFAMHLSRNGKTLSLGLLLFIPNEAAKPVPAFVGLNFGGNHTIHDDPGILMTKSWVRNNKATGITDNRANESTRGRSKSRWQAERIVKRGYALATMYYGDIDPDFDDGFNNGVHQLFNEKKPGPDGWGSIAAWAWGLSRIMDYFEQESTIDHTRIALMGHSRLGKTSLWAGAQDERFAIVISNNSGCGGAALSRRAIGETVARINSSFPHWFCENFTKYNGNESELPVDQHMLIALMAPRPVYVASAEEDRWADPKGEFLSAYHASPVYRLFGLECIESSEQPPVSTPVMNSIGYHIRPGRHDVTEYDWDRYMDFADKHLGK